MLEYGDKVAIVACSNAIMPGKKNQITELADTLTKLGLTPVFSPYIYQQTSVFSGNGKERASALTDFYNDDSIKAIFDVSGGDVANELLEFIDFNSIEEHPKPFFGYSDLTTIINAIYKKTGHCSYLYQVKCLVWESKEIQIADFSNSILHGQADLHRIKWHFIQGAKMEGVVIGGNVRCLLKLAGTPYMPDMDDKVLFLESYGGGVAQMTTYLCQLKQMGVFRRVSGLLLGTFTNMEENNEKPDIVELVLDVADDPSLPIARTGDIGHGSTSKCLAIGKHYLISCDN